MDPQEHDEQMLLGIFCQIEIPNINVSAALKHKPYRELFYELERARSFNLKLLDGALIQLQYKRKL